jgi:hypothetical protein
MFNSKGPVCHILALKSYSQWPYLSAIRVKGHEAMSTASNRKVVNRAHQAAPDKVKQPIQIHNTRQTAAQTQRL